MTGDAPTREIGCCGTYRRDATGIWRYPWGDEVPDATDLTLADLVSTDAHADSSPPPARTRLVSVEERERLGELLQESPLDAGGLIVGMSAPELHPTAMLTVDDIARLASLPRATIDRLLASGDLPGPQRSVGRTPLWTRPIVERWLRTRPSLQATHG